MLRDNLVGLIEPRLSSAGAYPLALCAEKKQPSDDRPPCLENPRPEGAESTLTGNAPSPFHAEPKHFRRRSINLGVLASFVCGRVDGFPRGFPQRIHGALPT
jgi:hypothetical protein